MNTPMIQKALACSNGFKLALPTKLSGFEGRGVGRRTGNALEFAEYRDYQPGDDIRRLDWGVYARKEQLMVRQFHEEVDPRCDLILDCSASMTVPTEKADDALGLAALLALAGANAGFSLSLWFARHEWKLAEHPELPLEWPSIAFDSGISPGESIHFFAGRFHRRGIRIVISDFLWACHPADFLRRICEGAQKSWLLRLDAFSLPQAEGDVTVSMTDSETGETRECLLDEELLKRYHARRESHRDLWSREAEQAGVELLDISHEALADNLACSLLVKKGLLSCG